MNPWIEYLIVDPICAVLAVAAIWAFIYYHERREQWKWDFMKKAREKDPSCPYPFKD